MQYNSLKELLNLSSSSKSYFLEQPVNIQMQLHDINNQIHSAYDLHNKTDLLVLYNKIMKN